MWAEKGSAEKEKALIIKLMMMDPVDSEVMLVANVILSIILKVQKSSLQFFSAQMWLILTE